MLHTFELLLVSTGDGRLPFGSSSNRDSETMDICDRLCLLLPHELKLLYFCAEFGRNMATVNVEWTEYMYKSQRHILGADYFAVDVACGEWIWSCGVWSRVLYTNPYGATSMVESSDDTAS